MKTILTLTSRDAQGDPRDAVPRSLRGQGARGRIRAGGVEARGGREGGPRGLCRDHDLHALPGRSLEEDPHQQRDRAPQPRDPPPHPRGRHLPGRQVGPHARHREAQVRREERVGVEALPGRDAAGRVAVPDGGPMGLSKSAQES